MIPLLLLAQLVLPGPPSGPIQPPGMICASGDCSGGPVVWRTSASKGRLVVACDMRSDTCSDGRQITTVRATPVPCEVSPGVWEMVPEDTGCYGVRGLESWGSTTSYLSWGAELDRSPWGSIRGGTLQPVADGWQVSNDPSQSNSGWVYMGGAADEGVTYTVACRVRAETPTTLRVSPLDAGGIDCPLHQVGAEWATVSCTQTAEAGRRERAHIWPGVEQSGPASVIVAACWLTKTDTPGRPCWGGEASVTCAADRHTISTEGWPTEAGEISMVFEKPLSSFSGTESAFFADGTRFQIKAVGTSHIKVFLNGVGSNLPITPIWKDGINHVRAVLSEGRLEVFTNGVSAGSVETEPIVYSGSISIGTTGLISLDGSISSLRVRSFE